MTNAQIFREAADYIRYHGLWRGPIGGRPASRCIWASIDAATHRNMDRGLPLGRAAAERATGSDEMHDLFRWNDAPERTATEVIALLYSLADDEELKDQIASLPPAVKEPLPVG